MFIVNIIEVVRSIWKVESDSYMQGYYIDTVSTYTNNSV